MRVYLLRGRLLWRWSSIGVTTLASLISCLFATAPSVHAQGAVDTTDRAVVAAFYNSFGCRRSPCRLRPGR